MNSLSLSIALRYLKSKRSGFISLISRMGFIGIAMGVAVLIIVMSVMNGFRTELIDKIPVSKSCSCEKALEEAEF